MTDNMGARRAPLTWPNRRNPSTAHRGPAHGAHWRYRWLVFLWVAAAASWAVCQDAPAPTKPAAVAPDPAAPDPAAPDPAAPDHAVLAKPTPAAPKKIPPEKDWLRAAKDYDVWLDVKQKRVIVGGRVCLREGLLEMFACWEGTKEHESVVAVQSPARFVHGALLALGAEPGPPVQFEPTYKPAQGTEVKVEVFWRDADGKEQRVEAQQWVRHVKTGEALKYPWVFAGSSFWTDETGKRFYSADGGDFICVSNFSTAMLDLPVESSAANDTLLFGAYTERIPPRDTPVLLFLTPKITAAPPSPAPAAEAHQDASKPGNDTAAPAATEAAKPPAKATEAGK